MPKTDELTLALTLLSANEIHTRRAIFEPGIPAILVEFPDATHGAPSVAITAGGGRVPADTNASYTEALVEMLELAIEGLKAAAALSRSGTDS